MVFGLEYRKIKKAWVFIRVPYMSPNILGVIGPGFLNQVASLAG